MSYFSPPFPRPPNRPKNENIKKWKKILELSSIYTSVPKIMIIGDTVPEIWLFYLASSPKCENFKTMKKTPGDVIILHKCTKNHDHMPICSWDIWHVTYIIVVFHFFGNFFPFTPNSPKTQNFKKMKRKPWRYCHFTYMY